MAIFDGNFTTLLVAVILFIFGESSVKGFATMLIISTIITMLVMVYLTRTLLDLFVKTGKFDNKLGLFIGYKEKSKQMKTINFIKMRKGAYAYLVIMLIVGVVSLCTNKLELGIDFKGGSSINIVGEEKVNITNFKKDLKELGYTVYDSEVIDSKSVILKVSESFNKSQVLEVEEHFTEKYNVKTEIGVISNIVKKNLVKNAALSLLIASLFIVLYISFRFKFSYAISGIVALIHDALIIVFIFSLFKLEVTSIFIAAILSIIGYSINDTIVSFDRFREYINRKGKIKDAKQLEEIVNTSLTVTLGRSIVTTITTLCPVVCLMLFGAHEIINFNLALFVGLVAGVLSSIFIASQLWYDIEKKSIGKPVKKKWYEEEDKVKEKKVKGVNA